MITDVSAWVGTYPFRGIIHSSLDDLRNKSQTLGIDRFITSSFDNLFQENNFDAFERWAPILSEHSHIEHWPVVNPAMPGQLRRLERIVTEYQPRGIRLLPNYHDYSLRDHEVGDLMAFADQHHLVVQIFSMIADPRWHFMLKVPPVDSNDLDWLISQYAQSRMIISAHPSLQHLAPQAKQCPHLYLDVSRVRGPVLAMEKLVTQIPAHKLLFGSLWPIQIIEATLWQITQSNLSCESHNLLLYNNFQSLMA